MGQLGFQDVYIGCGFDLTKYLAASEGQKKRLKKKQAARPGNKNEKAEAKAEGEAAAEAVAPT